MNLPLNRPLNSQSPRPATERSQSVAHRRGGFEERFWRDSLPERNEANPARLWKMAGEDQLRAGTNPIRQMPKNHVGWASPTTEFTTWYGFRGWWAVPTLRPTRARNEANFVSGAIPAITTERTRSRSSRAVPTLPLTRARNEA